MLKNKRRFSRGFTLIELLVVIVILGILATVGLTFFTSSQMRGRDGKRKSDLKQIAAALELYNSDYGSYPSSSGGLIKGCPTGTAPCQWGGSEFTDGKTTYMKIVPADPSGGSYWYRTVAVNGTDFQGFQLYARLENPQDINCLPDLEGQPSCSQPALPTGTDCGSAGSCNFAVTSANVSPSDE
ncbi:MAG: hypothetical protein UV71_C0006G0013 [Microgenomates group bacterium GW2011_GWC1_43_13]|uniref:Type II secretory pathway pseudopilin n=2 Tax=Candidatus Woeseibacteriota TaxID=1752722 RepID=A0A837IJW1_9BACT|nr:MAG: hypothetical protein UV71_C0006G0013 [Microgenomates group bacterium GW2011_GWC1_43_13]KKT32568.1 MAG: Type II secretory pathway pseudopilin [Candidatus Woesebacteria bacterium GW2011_GWB1_44_11]KKT54283.1 MAG: Type II secretory pathway pseudopilin [Candidatus Woesebacteria bacterium GW2011_GWA1_44_23]OGM76664.1 MAG: hypothetical protein A2208_03085 [Candidatus Woesebacteria bacterium RIFOXYA1_FULL_43_16]OGM83159.1 MAG: hypothetical protein A2394_02640 [Candidatus Woesebacteria bacteriu